MDLLGGARAFQQLPQAKQRQVLHDTALIADALVGKGEPGTESVASRAMAGGTDQWQQDKAAVDAIGDQPFTSGAAREGAAVAGEYLKQVNFVDFVSGLIDGVFHSIVTSNIQQMEAYSKMVADVSKSLNQFRDDNTTPDQGKDQLLEQFPDVFDMGVDSFSGSQQPQLKLKDGVDQDSALNRVRGSLGSYAESSIDSIDVSDPDVQETLIKAARGQIATSRQQLLATMVVMGLSRIVVTNGKISAKIMYDFSASTQRQLSRSAQALDYARDSMGNLQVLTNSEPAANGSSPSDPGYQAGSSTYTGTYDANYYLQGLYKYTQRPTLTARSMAQEVENDNFSAKASLAGQVEVNFKSDYLPLEKMATPEMMAAIQMRSKPIDNNRPQYAPGQAPSQTAAPTPAAPATPPPAAPPPAPRQGA
jgi:hypothetical protein